MRKMKIRITNTTYVYCCIVIWNIVSVVFGGTVIGKTLGIDRTFCYNTGRAFVYAVLILQLQRRNFPRERLLILSMMAASLVVSIFGGGGTVLLSFVLFILAASDICMDKHKTGQIYFMVHAGILFMNVALVSMGILDMNVKYRGALARYSYGYNHPNVFAQEVFISILSFIYFKWESLKKRYFVLFIWAALAMYYYSNSRTSVLVLLICFLLAWCMRYTKIPFSIYRIIGYGVFYGSMFVTIYSAIALDRGNLFLRSIDDMMSGRLSAMHNAYVWNGFSLISSSMKQRTITIDNSFAYILFYNGIIIFVLFMIFTGYCFGIIARMEDKSLLLIAIAVTLYGFMEDTLFSIECNMLPVLLAPEIMGNLKIMRRMDEPCLNKRFIIKKHRA